MKYRKKPVVIEATQWFKAGDHPAVTKFEKGCGWVDTLEGGHIVTPGDWIITGVKGEHYPCKPDIFEMTYLSAVCSDPAYAVVRQLVEALESLLNDVGRANSMLGAVKARAALAAAKEAGL